MMVIMRRKWKKLVLGEFEDVFSEVPGSTERVIMSIDTGVSEPIRQAPYSVPLGIREKVREELLNLEHCGIIERCDSCWASPLVPVKKSDGGLRLCVDFRKLNDTWPKGSTRCWCVKQTGIRPVLYALSVNFGSEGCRLVSQTLLQSFKD